MNLYTIHTRRLGILSLSKVALLLFLTATSCTGVDSHQLNVNGRQGKKRRAIQKGAPPNPPKHQKIDDADIATSSVSTGSPRECDQKASANKQRKISPAELIPSLGSAYPRYCEVSRVLTGAHKDGQILANLFQKIWYKEAIEKNQQNFAKLRNQLVNGTSLPDEEQRSILRQMETLAEQNPYLEAGLEACLRENLLPRHAHIVKTTAKAILLKLRYKNDIPAAERYASSALRDIQYSQADTSSAQSIILQAPYTLPIGRMREEFAKLFSDYYLQWASNTYRTFALRALAKLAVVLPNHSSTRKHIRPKLVKSGVDITRDLDESQPGIVISPQLKAICLDVTKALATYIAKASLSESQREETRVTITQLINSIVKHDTQEEWSDDFIHDYCQELETLSENPAYTKWILWLATHTLCELLVTNSYVAGRRHPDDKDPPGHHVTPSLLETICLGNGQYAYKEALRLIQKSLTAIEEKKNHRDAGGYFGAIIATRLIEQDTKQYATEDLKTTLIRYTNAIISHLEELEEFQRLESLKTLATLAQQKPEWNEEIKKHFTAWAGELSKSGKEPDGTDEVWDHLVIYYSQLIDKPENEESVWHELIHLDSDTDFEEFNQAVKKITGKERASQES